MAIVWTYDTPKAERMTRSLGVQTGTADFGTATAGGLSSAGVEARFITCLAITFAGNDGYVHQWIKSTSLIPTYEAGADGAPLDEVTSGDVGQCEFIAIGTV